MNSQEAYEQFQGIEVELPKKQGKGIVCGYDNDSLVLALTVAPQNHDGWTEDENEGMNGLEIVSNKDNVLGYWYASTTLVEGVINGN